jgi:hypothetical protein
MSLYELRNNILFKVFSQGELHIVKKLSRIVFVDFGVMDKYGRLVAVIYRFVRGGGVCDSVKRDVMFSIFTEFGLTNETSYARSN